MYAHFSGLPTNANAVLDTVAMDLASSNDFPARDPHALGHVAASFEPSMPPAALPWAPARRDALLFPQRLHSAGPSLPPPQQPPSQQQQQQQVPPGAPAFALRPSTSGDMQQKPRPDSSSDSHAATTTGLSSSFEVSVKTFRIPGFEINHEGLKAVPVVPQQKKSPRQPADAAASVALGAAAGHLAPATLSVDQSPAFSGSYSGEMLDYSDCAMERKGDVAPAPRTFRSFVRSPSELVRLSNVGRGACGTVVRALHLPTLKLVAIKQIAVFDKDRRHQLVKELRGLAATAEMNELISLHGAFFDEGCVSLVLEYMNRLSLQELLNQHGPMHELLLQRVCLQAVRGLAHLHAQHLIHRDIKPGNILINHKAQVKLADFGVLAALEHSRDFAKSYVGTVMYMSPERIGGAYGTAADVWSLGQTLITLATGHTPYDTGAGYFGIVRKITQEPPPSLPCSSTTNPTHVAAGIRAFSPELCSFVASCLVTDASQRWTARQLLEHPFLQHAEATWAGAGLARQQTLAVIGRLAQADVTDIQALLQIVAEKCYLETGDQYRRSLFDLARVAKLADEIGIDCKDLQELFESTYRQAFARWQATHPLGLGLPPPIAPRLLQSAVPAMTDASGALLTTSSQLLPPEHPTPPVVPIDTQTPVTLKLPMHRRKGTAH